MSEITRGVIGMPFDMAMGSELSRRQFHSVAQGLLAEVERMTAIAYAVHGSFRMETLAERDQLKAENERLNVIVEQQKNLIASLRAELVESRSIEVAEIKQARINVLRGLMGETSQKEFAELHDLDASYLSQLLNGHRTLGEKAAANLEKKIGLPEGSLVMPGRPLTQ